MALARRALPAFVPPPARRLVLRPGEWRWPVLLAFLVLLVSVGPIALASMQTAPGTTFTGYVVIGVDAPVYVAAWRQGWVGAWLFHAMFTSEPIPPVLVYAWYIWSGHLVGWLAGPWLYHATRLAAGMALLLAVYGLAAELFKPRRLRQIAFVLAALGGGVGAFLGTGVQVGPIGLRATEMSVSGTSVSDLIAMAPHLPWSAALLCLLLATASRYGRTGSRSSLALAVACQLGLELIYPQLSLLAVVVIAALAILERSRVLGVAAAGTGLVLAPYATYLGLVALRSPAALTPLRFTFDLGDPFGFLVLSHLVATALIVSAFAGRRLPRALWLPALWIAVMTVFMFTPGLSGVMGRSFVASSVPFGLMAGAALTVLGRRVRGRAWRRRLVAVSVAGSSFFGLYSLAHPYAIAAGRLDPAAEYERADEARLLEWVAPRTRVETVVLTTYLEGLFVPAQTNARAYVGHPDQTIDAADKAALALAFFDQWSAEQRDAFLRANHIAYVLAPDPERIDRLRDDPMLTMVRRTGGTALFEVRR